MTGIVPMCKTWERFGLSFMKRRTGSEVYCVSRFLRRFIFFCARWSFYIYSLLSTPGMFVPEVSHGNKIYFRPGD
jgi:hypothetical protein